ncbi:CoA-transferase family III [Peniophora sp. CONT]|nr:CoA-transferase family III [Peniophora sp. CONT]
MAPSSSAPAKPLAGIKVVEFAGLAPVPFAGLILADFGASVVRIDRIVQNAVAQDVLSRGKRSVALDWKSKEGLDIVKQLIRGADVVLDPFRPGVLEKMGLGPDVWLGKENAKGENERLVFARIAGYKRDGPHRDLAGHDINYLAMSGVLSLLPGTPEKPSFPLNLLSDFAGGGLTCALGILVALFERVSSGRGQVVDADMVSGTRYLATYPFLHHTLRSPLFASADSKRQLNVLDAGAPFYNVYTCSDWRPIAVGALEPHFFKTFLEGFLGAVPKTWLEREEWLPDLDVHGHKELWPKFKDFLERGFKLRTRDEWADTFAGTDACVTPVLAPSEAAAAHAGRDYRTAELDFARDTPQAYIASPAPSLSRTPAHACNGPIRALEPGKHSWEVLAELGFESAKIDDLVRQGVVGAVDAKAKL